jgi:hypothetical protein
VCPSGAQCVAGACTCAPGQIRCGGSCVDPASDSEHCGSCATACAPVNACTSGTCGWDRLFADGFG